MTQDEIRLQQLDDAIGRGVKSIYSDGERVEYQDTSAMLKARDVIWKRIQNARNGGRQKFRPIRIRPVGGY